MRLRDKLARPSASARTPRISTSSPTIAACFRCSGCPSDVVEQLKADNGIYMINDSRINVAGIPEDRVGELADSCWRPSDSRVNWPCGAALRCATIWHR